MNGSAGHAIGVYLGNGGGNYLSAYLADVYFIDGQALTPSSFGQYNGEGNVWVPKAYAGTYGTTGFHLTFNDKSNTTAGTLGADSSGNGNNWTPNNFSVTAGVNDDVLRDVPSAYTDSNGDHANFATLNPLDKGGAHTLSDGNLKYVGDNSTNSGIRGMAAVSSGKWYWEVTAVTAAGGLIGASKLGDSLTSPGNGTWLYYHSNGNKYNSGVNSAYGNSYTNGDVIGVALDLDNQKIWWSKNGTWQAGGDPTAGTNAAYTSVSGSVAPAVWDADGSNIPTLVANFGQRPFAYTPPTGFKAVNTYNIATTAFVPDLVWVKGRSGATAHGLHDSARGVSLDLESQSTSGQTSQTTGLLGFNAGGFNIGSLAKLNTSAATYVAWMWKKGATPGFDTITYTGTGSGNRAVAHSLGATPKFIIVKRYDASGDHWAVYHGDRANKYLFLSLTNAEATDGGSVWGTSTPTSTNFYVGTSGSSNQSAASYVAYLWAEVPGFSKFGSYTGNGSADGPFIYTGFRPAYILVKRTDTAGESWQILDNMRDTYNPPANMLIANNSNGDTSSGIATMDFLSNGFKQRSADGRANASGGTYIYAAFAEQPFKYSRAR